MPTPTVQNIHIGQGEIWVGGTAPTAGTDLTDPTAGTPSALNAMASGFTAPTSGGTYVGFTNGAATLTYKPTFYMVETEQAFAEVAIVPTGEEASLAFTVLELTYQNLKTAWGQVTSRVVTGPPVQNALYVGSKATVPVNVVAMMSRKRSGVGYYILTVYQGYSFEGSALPFVRREDTKVATTVRCLADLTRPLSDQLFQFVEYPANPT
jgi:hypothetical protein